MSYTFQNLGRIGSDPTDNTQRNISNTRFNDYQLTNAFGANKISDSHVKFATNQPDVLFNGLTNGNGLNGSLVEFESLLTLKNEQERSLEKVQLFQRPFATVPYLGRGSCDPVFESILQQGSKLHQQKSVNTIMEQSFLNYTMRPLDENMSIRTNDPSFTVEEAALDGWVRGGMGSRIS